MKKTMKIAVLLCFVAICFLSLTLPCVAIEPNWTANFTVEQSSAADGMVIVRVSVSDISSESGIICAIYNLHYDNKALELVSWKNGLPASWDFSGEVYAGEDWSGVLESEGEKYFMYTVMNVKADNGVKNDDILYTEIQFKVLDKTAAETKLEFTKISFIDTNDLEKGTSLDLADKTITVMINNEATSKYYKCDINGDGKINAIDYALLKRYVLGTVMLSDDELVRADINNDEKINAIDYAMVKRYILKGPSER